MPSQQQRHQQTNDAIITKDGVVLADDQAIEAAMLECLQEAGKDFGKKKRRPPGAASTSKDPDTSQSTVISDPKGLYTETILSCGLHRDDVLAAFHENEDGDAKLFKAINADKFLFDHSANKWYYWNDHYWRIDKVKQVMNKIQEIIAAYKEEAKIQKNNSEVYEEAGDKKQAKELEAISKKLFGRVHDLQTLNRKKSIMELVTMGVNSLGDPGEKWDSNPLILGCKNGVIDLTTGMLRPGLPSDMIKTVSPIPYPGISEPCPTWLQFLRDISDDNEEVVLYLQRLLGYGITGFATEAVHPVLWGAKGRNGKTTMLETIKFVLGELAYKAPASFLVQGRVQKSEESPDAVMMALRGRRIVWCSETNEGDRLNPSKLKELSGDDTISARPPYGKHQIEFKPSHLLLLLTNKRPKIPANDQALWRRIHLLPFQYSYLPNPDPLNPLERKEDKGLKARIQAEAPGILAWLVRGAILWQKQGLNPPDCIVAATAEYQSHEDILNTFILDCCETGNGRQVRQRDLYERYQAWCDESGHNRLARRNFYEGLREKFNTKTIHGFDFFNGIELKPAY